MRKIFLPVIFSFGCAFSINGSNVPTEHTSQLAPKDISQAEEFIVKCALDWIGPEPEQNKVRALEELEDYGIKIIARNPFRFATAFRRRLLVGKDFYSKPTWEQVELLTHEIIHYCERDILGDKEFEKMYGESAGRWSLEIPAQAQVINTGIAHGASAEQADKWIESELPHTQKYYWLYNIDPKQYEEETKRIWSEMLGF